ncbi:MAG: nicotinate phosphoribosyltransferase [Gammaproteobacteria bacterium RIFCSPHIGHO2_12_FULL_41_15]|nr:MAG: nicotinate phosphoribosyltransferase [Gammaproteobacteria bacterium RIFCSPHIGHO2_12_FULL_41_15]
MNTQSALLTDFYQLTMAHGYWQNNRTDTEAVFHLFFRRHPFQGDFTIACGLEPAIEFLQNWQFTQTDIHYLASLTNKAGRPQFQPAFLDYLHNLKFECDIDAVKEGTLMFPTEPLLRIKGPLIQCQLLETALLNLYNISSLIATKAARIRLAAGDDPIAEFGLRRAQGPNGGLLASRAAFIGGTNSTSNVLAGKQYHIPVSGTVAHSWIMSYPTELDAFKATADLMGSDTVLLVDTYHTENGVKNAIKTAKYLQTKNEALFAIRLDSGDLPMLAKQARNLLDAAGLQHVKIIISGDLDEYKIAEFKQRHAPIDIWGVGTRLATAFDYPALDITYKLGAIKNNKEEAWQYKMKITDDGSKKSIPGILQVRRYYHQSRPIADYLYHDIFGIDDALQKDADASIDLLEPILRKGELVNALPTTAEVREFAQQQLMLWRDHGQANYAVKLEAKLKAISNPE